MDEAPAPLAARLAAWLRPTPPEALGLVVLLLGAVLATAVLWHQATSRPRPVAEVVDLGASVDDAGVVDGPAPGVDAPRPADDGQITVQVTGAVHRGGVVTIGAGSRVGEAIAALGGVSPDADLAAVNLARRLADGEHVHVPAIGESPPPAGGRDRTGGRSMPLDVNRASADELTELPGVGPVRAAAIVEHRERVGPFGVPGDLRDVAGIGEAIFQQLAPLITTG